MSKDKEVKEEKKEVVKINKVKPREVAVKNGRVLKAGEIKE